MELEKNPKTRKLYRRLLELEDTIGKRPFPQMKRVRQITSSHCGPAVLSALFSFLGVSVSQRRITKSLRAAGKIKKYGLGIKEMAKAAKIYGKKGKFVFWKKSGASVANLGLIVNKYKWPVGVEWQGVFYEFEDEDSGHYGVITGVDKKKDFLRIMDPFGDFAGVDRKFRLPFFVKRWWDTNFVSGREIKDKRVMFVITPKGESWPRNLGMKKI